MLRSIYEFILCVYVAYFLGCVNAAYYYSTIVHDVDIRNFGSGNAGTTNILRVFGLRAAIIVLLLDILKGAFAVLVAKEITQSPVIITFAALFVIIGHCMPIFINFRGGKGIATSIGIFLAFNPQATLVTLLLGAIVIAIFKYVSLGSIIGMISLAAIFYLFNAPVYQIITAVLLAALTVYQHRANISRIIHGTESKLDLKR